MKHPQLAAGRVQSWGVQIIDLPSGAAVGMCRRLSPIPRAAPPADRNCRTSGPASGFLHRRTRSARGWPLDAGDPDRIRTYFPEVVLVTPAT